MAGAGVADVHGLDAPALRHIRRPPGHRPPRRGPALLAGLTPRWSSEFALRPFIEHQPEITYNYLGRWITHGDEHVRRLVSEGTRPRLSWAPQLRGLIADPSPNLPLLDGLADGPSPYVRRSVANHLNDIAKDHPDLAVDLARRWGTAAAAAPGSPATACEHW